MRSRTRHIYLYLDSLNSTANYAARVSSDSKFSNGFGSHTKESGKETIKYARKTILADKRTAATIYPSFSKKWEIYIYLVHLREWLISGLQGPIKQ